MTQDQAVLEFCTVTKWAQISDGGSAAGESECISERKGFNPG